MIFSLPFKAFNSIATTVKTTLPPTSETSSSAHFKVPPVARRSSIINRFFPLRFLFCCKLNVELPYSNSYFSHIVVEGSFPFFLIGINSLDAKVLELKDSVGQYDLGLYLEWFKDEDSSKTFEEMRSGSVEFNPGDAEELNFGFTSSTYWLKFEVAVNEKITGNW